MGSFIEGYRRLITHPRYGIWVILATLLYLISPIDISPDFLPLLGQIDDVALVVLVISATGQWLGQRFLENQSADNLEDSPEQDSIRQTINVEAVEVEPPD